VIDLLVVRLVPEAAAPLLQKVLHRLGEVVLQSVARHGRGHEVEVHRRAVVPVGALPELSHRQLLICSVELCNNYCKGAIINTCNRY
jgi:hypothetical protein